MRICKYYHHLYPRLQDQLPLNRGSLDAEPVQERVVPIPVLLLDIPQDLRPLMDEPPQVPAVVDVLRDAGEVRPEVADL